MHLFSLCGNDYRLDGGAMFGNAPRVLWEQWLPPDESNRVRLATRALLALAGRHVILFETGIGTCMEPSLRKRYGVDQPGHVLADSLAEKGITPPDITHIFFSHLHFDHCGGVMTGWQVDRSPDLLFPNASFNVSRQAWERANHPHPRDRASFIPHLHTLLVQSGRLNLIEPQAVFTFADLEVRFFSSRGHTPGLIAPDLRFGSHRLVYASDLIPAKAWVHLPISMGYDRCPELLVDEKRLLLESLAAENAWLGFTHDPDHAASRIKVDPVRSSFTPVDPVQELELQT